MYSVSHDLRAPLVNLQGFGGELKATCEDLRKILAEGTPTPAAMQRGLALVDDDMATSIRFIQTAVLRLSSIVNALLQFSCAGRIEYEFQSVDTQAIVARVIDSFSVTIAERGATVAVGDLPTLWGDPTAIERVVANLIGNVLNYLDPDRTGMIEVGSLPPVPWNVSAGDGPSRTIYIRDNGLGIPTAYREKLFQIFQRLHPQVAAGEGIGLATVLRIVGRHGGRVWFESIEGQGTTFFVSLPTTKEQPSSLAGAKELERAHQPGQLVH